MWKLLFVSFVCACNASLLDKFENWVHTFAIQFKDKHHFNDVFLIWKQNDKFIDETNAKNLTYQLGHNPFSGMDAEQFRTFMGFSILGDSKYEYLTSKPTVTDNLPQSIDWSEKGAVTPIKNQGQCGSCWSFSATGALEGAYYAKYKILESFSEQQLVDCDTRRNGGKDMGCNGGLMDNAFAWIEKNGGLCAERDYPYVSGTTKTGNTCQTNCEVVIKSGIKEFVDVFPSSEDAMKTAVVERPVSIAVEADQREFQLYKSGVFTGTCGTKLDHGVLLVGYGSLNGINYWKVKNSWSSDWGLNGYILLGRGPEYNSGDGQCGLLLQGSYPLL
jgi:C1A family cysteine protease